MAKKNVQTKKELQIRHKMIFDDIEWRMHWIVLENKILRVIWNGGIWFVIMTYYMHDNNTKSTLFSVTVWIFEYFAAHLGRYAFVFR